MTFDPFGDFETQDYLRNLVMEKDPDIVRRLEHASFMTGIDAGTVFRPRRSMWFFRRLKVAGDEAEDYRSQCMTVTAVVVGPTGGSLASCALRAMRGGSSSTAQLIQDPERL